MTNVLNEYPSDGVSTSFEVAMLDGYLNRDYVRFYLRPADDLVAWVPYTLPVTWVGPFTFTITEPVPSGMVLVVMRETVGSPLVDFENTSRITERNLNTAFKQSLHRTVELEDWVNRNTQAQSNTAALALAAAQDSSASALASAQSAQVATGLVSAAEAAAQASAESAAAADAEAQAATTTAEQALSLIEAAVKGNVDSFNGRDGAVLPQKGDYTPEQVGFELSGVLSGSPAWVDVPAWSSNSYGQNSAAQALTNRTALLKQRTDKSLLSYPDYAAASAAAATLPDGQEVIARDVQFQYVVASGALVPLKAITTRIDLRSFGAKGDNGVTNNKVAIEAAIAAADGKKTIWVPVGPDGGSYLVTSGALTIPSTARFEYEAGARIAASGAGSISDAGRHFYLFAGATGEGQASTLTRGFAIELNGGNSGTAPASTLQFNRIRILGDTLDAEPDSNGTKVDGLLVHHSFGGAGTKGGRHAIEAILDQTAITEATNPDRNYVAVTGLTQTSVGDGGSQSASPSTYKGAYFGSNFYGRLNPGAVGVYNVTGCEFNCVAHTGSSVWYRSGIQIIGGGGVQGDSVDAAVAISNLGTATTRWRNAIRIGNMNGTHAIDENSKVLVALASGSVQSGFEIPPCTEYVLKSGDVSLTNTRFELAASNAQITLGDDNTAGTSIINGRTSGLNATYDARIVFSGGTATQGSGVLSAQAATVQLAATSEITFAATLRPATDNAMAFGRTDRRVTVVYAATGSINTSDEREKQQWHDQSEAEKEAALEIRKSIKAFKFSDAVNAKGDTARWHFGVGAQTVGNILRDHGLNPEEYAFWCYDEWAEQHEIKDETGNITQEYRAAGNRYGIRYDELAMFILSAI